MSTFLYELGRCCYRSHQATVAIWGVALAVLVGVVVITDGSRSDHSTMSRDQSQVTSDEPRTTFPTTAATRATVIVVAPDGHSVDDPQIRAAIEAGATEFGTLPIVSEVISPWHEHFPGLVSGDNRAALIELQLAGHSSQITDEHRASLVDEAVRVRRTLPAGTSVNVGGEAFDTGTPGLTPIEPIGVGVALVALTLTLTLASLVTAGLPILGALGGVAISFASIWMAAALAPVNSTTPLLAAMLGLALGVEYALFIISRHRDQVVEGYGPEESAAGAVGTAGPGVVLAALTTIIALLGLTLTQIPSLSAMGAFASVAVGIAVLAALTLTPAMLGFVGGRIEPSPRREPGNSRSTGLLSTWLRTVTARPTLMILLVSAGLGVLGLPALDLHTSPPSSGQHPAGQPDRVTFDLIAEHFGPGANAPIIVTADTITGAAPLGLMDGLRSDIEAMPGVSQVAAVTLNPNADAAVIRVIPSTGPQDAPTADLVHALRNQHDRWLAEFGVSTAVTGTTAVQIDISERLEAALLPFAVFVVGVGQVLLTTVFRSVWVPVEATLGYLLSVGATVGITRLVFAEGRLSWLVNLDGASPIVSFAPIVIMAVLFGLAMGHEVFLVSRIRAEYVHGLRADPRANPHDVAGQAVHEGFVASGKGLAAAAVIMFAVFAFFVSQGVGPIKQIAFGLAVGVAVDAFLVRLTLVPAVLWLLGARAWRLPRLLDRALPSFDVEPESLTQRNWPTPEHTEALHAKALRSADLFEPVWLHLEPGEVGVVVGEAAPRSAALLAISGRLRTTHGQARVAGELLPERAAHVRRGTGFVEIAGNASIADDLRAQLSRPKRVVVVNGVDAIAAPADLKALNELIAQARLSRGFAVVLGVRRATAATSYRPEVIIPVVVPRRRRPPQGLRRELSVDQRRDRGPQRLQFGAATVRFS